MESNLSGKTISDVKILKTKVVVYFSKTDKFEISKDTYTFFYLFVGKTLSNKQIIEIKKTDRLNNYLSYAVKLCTKSLITEGKLKSKLYQKGANSKDIANVMKLLKANDLISDDGYIQDYILYADEMLYGELKIKDNLVKKGISSDKVNKIKFSKSKELAKAKRLCKKLEQNNARYSYQVKKKKIYNSLLSKGFTSDIAISALSSVKMDKDDKLLDKEVKTALTTWLLRNKDKYDNNKDLFNACYAYLKRKGYSYSKIKQIWGENYEFDD